MWHSEEEMLIKQKIPDDVDPTEWEIIEETHYYGREFIMRIYKVLRLIYRKFRR